MQVALWTGTNRSFVAYSQQHRLLGSVGARPTGTVQIHRATCFAVRRGKSGPRGRSPQAAMSIRIGCAQTVQQHQLTNSWGAKNGYLWGMWVCVWLRCQTCWMWHRSALKSLGLPTIRAFSFSGSGRLGRNTDTELETCQKLKEGIMSNQACTGIIHQIDDLFRLAQLSAMVRSFQLDFVLTIRNNKHQQHIECEFQLVGMSDFWRWQ